MGPLGVVAVDEVVELGLLLKEVLPRRLGGLELEGEVHSLMAAVLLRATELDALDGDAEAQPPPRAETALRRDLAIARVRNRRSAQENW